MKWKPLFLLCMLAINASAVLAKQADLSRLDQLIQNGAYDEAFLEAEAHLGEEEGNPKFDYLYGIAALKTDHIGPALFAFERVMMIEPGNDQAQYYYAYAYYQSKLYARAYLEARKLKGKKLSDALQQDVDKLILKVTREERAEKQKWIFVSITDGYDTNVNGGVNQSGVQLVNVGFVPLELDAKQFKSHFIETKLGAGFVWPLHGKLTTQVTGSWRRNDQAHLFDTDDYGLFVRYQFPLLAYQVAFPLVVEHEDLNHKQYRDSASAGMELAYPVSKSFTMRTFAHIAAFDYPDDASQTSKIYWGGLGFEKQYSWQAFTNVKPYWGVQTIHDRHFNYDDRTFTGIDLHFRYNKFQKFKPYGYFSFQYSIYQHPHPILETGMKTREDDFYHAEIGVDWRVIPHVYLSLAGIRERNQSNFDVFEYRRKIIKLSVTYSSL